MKNFLWDVSYIGVVIGKTTEKYMIKYYQYYLADKPSIKSCIEKAMSLQMGLNNEKIYE